MERVEKQLPDQLALAKEVLLWIIFTKRPLTTLELRHAIAVKGSRMKLDETALPDDEDMISACAGLVTVDKESSIIRLVHYTTQQYFEKTREKWFPNGEADITKTCITYMSFDAFRSGYCRTDEEFEQRLRENPLYDYAAHNWGYHARQASSSCEETVLFLRAGSLLVAASQAMLVAKLLPYQSDYSQYTPKRITGLHLAAYFGTQNEMQILLHTNGPDLMDSHDRTAASYAAENGHQAVLHLLLERGAEIDLEDCSERTPLFYAAAAGQESNVRLLLSNGAYSDSDDNCGQTPLSCASENGHELVVRLLLDEGAQVNSMDCGERTPLSYASENGHEAIIQLLLQKGAMVDSDGVEHASYNGHESVVRLLLERGAEADKANWRGQTPLFLAAEGGYEAVVQLLLKNGARVDSQTICYCSSGQSIDADHTDRQSCTAGETPLMAAARQGHMAVVHLLLKNGANPRSKDSTGQTPLSYAVKHGREDVAKVLAEVQPWRSDGSQSVAGLECIAKRDSERATALGEMPTPGKTSSLKRPISEDAISQNLSWKTLRLAATVPNPTKRL